MNAPTRPVRPPAHRQRVRRRAAELLTAVLAAVTVTATPSPASAHTAGNTKPVLLVHGLDLAYRADCAELDPLGGALRSAGFTGPIVKLGYYAGDRNCNVSLRSSYPIGDQSSWIEFSRAFSWYVWNNYTRWGIAVDAVGHSMGGLIIRGAILGSRNGFAGFAPPIDIEDAVTLGTPHKGAPVTALCGAPCARLAPGSPEIAWLNQDSLPQGRYGTDWTTYGSTGDVFVPVSSSNGMAVLYPASYVFQGVTHIGSTGYLRDFWVQFMTASALYHRGK